MIRLPLPQISNNNTQHQINKHRFAGDGSSAALTSLAFAEDVALGFAQSIQTAGTRAGAEESLRQAPALLQRSKDPATYIVFVSIEPALHVPLLRIARELGLLSPDCVFVFHKEDGLALGPDP